MLPFLIVAFDGDLVDPNPLVWLNLHGPVCWLRIDNDDSWSGTEMYEVSFGNDHGDIKMASSTKVAGGPGIGTSNLLGHRCLVHLTGKLECLNILIR